MYAEHIRQLRKEAGLTQSELAEKAGVSRTTVCDWERGAYPPTDANNIATLEDVFQLMRGELYKILQEPNPTQAPVVEQGTEAGGTAEV